VPEIEQQLQLRINLFTYHDEEGVARAPLYISKQEQFGREIDLLFFNGHYAWIHNFSGFLFDVTKDKNKKLFCKQCFGHFSSAGVVRKHKLFCNHPNFTSQIYVLAPDSDTIKFKNEKYMLRQPFVIYADFECLTEQRELPDGVLEPSTFAYQQHKPNSAAFTLLKPDGAPASLPTIELHVGEESSKWFLSKLLEIQKTFVEYVFDSKRLVMTKVDWKVFNASNTCHICDKAIDKKSKKRFKVCTNTHLLHNLFNN
jgi:hypothetical protein